MENRIYYEDVDEDFDNLTGERLTDNKIFCVFCGTELQVTLCESMICEQCITVYEEGKKIADNILVELIELISFIKKAFPTNADIVISPQSSISSEILANGPLFKIILAGGSIEAKTHFLTKYTNWSPFSDTRITIGIDFAAHYLKLSDSISVRYQIWSIDGAKRFRTLVPSYCQGSSGALLFFDLMKQNTLYELDEWIFMIRNYSCYIPIILIGYNYDRKKNTDNFSINPIEVLTFIRNNKINGYLSVNIETGYNVDTCFIKLTEFMMKSIKKNQQF